MYAVYAGYVNTIYAVDVGFSRWQPYAMEEPLSERIITPMPKSLVSAVDDYRYANRIASRAEAIRRLIELGLRAPPSPEREPSR